MEDAMRIFERLRGRDQARSNVERKLLETITGDLIRRIEDVTEVTVLPESKSTSCSCCSNDEKAPR
jgi:hypothetical protein